MLLTTADLCHVPIYHGSVVGLRDAAGGAYTCRPICMSRSVDIQGGTEPARASIARSSVTSHKANS